MLTHARTPVLPFPLPQTDAPALIDGDERWSYADLRLAVDRVASSLPDATERRRICVVPLAATPDAIAAYLGVLAAGHVAAIVEPGREGTCDAIAPDLAWQGGRFVALVGADDAPEPHPELAVLMSTSGSTGSPKLVRLSHDNLRANAEAIAQSLALSREDRAITSLPLHYCYGLSVLHSHLAAGASLVLSDDAVSEREFWNTAERQAVTTIAAVPHSMRMMRCAGLDARALPSLRRITVAGGRMAPADVVEVHALGRRAGWDLVVMYGQTEATARMCVLDPHDAAAHPDSVGRAVPGGWFSVEQSVAEDGDIAPIAGDRAIGELVYHGPNVMLGYATTRDDLAAGRAIDALRTGDLGYLDDDGRVRIVGRRSGFLKILGKRIDVQNVEDLLARDGIRACVTGNDDRLQIAVETDDPVSESGLRSRAATLAGLPCSAVRVIGFSSLPLLSSGKLDRETIRREFAESTSAAPSGAPGVTEGGGEKSDIDEIRQIFAHCLDRGAVGDDDSFVSLRGDSLSYVELSVRLEAVLGDLPDDWQERTIRELAATSQSPSRWASVESSIVLRVLATVTVLGTHVGLFTFLGGAHALLALVGYNLARFSMAAPNRKERTRRLGGVLATIGIPTFILVAVAHLVNEQYTLANLLQVRWIFGPFNWGPHAQLWFIEAALWSVIVLIGLLAIPAVSRWYDAHPFWVALAALPVALIPRYFFLEQITSPVRGLLPWVFWLVLIGIAVAHANTIPKRLLINAIAIATIAGFFGSPLREAYVAGAVLALIWIPRIRLPRFLALAAAPIAGASLYIYLVQWQVFGHFESAVLGFIASIAAGLAVWALVRRVRRPLLRITTPIGTNAR
ncbi:AMP-binding protein [Epidermidibacterium keratini]|uniref:AMP-binding protein n=1 Tax=Epidermidibacterium keratini TaxID=1891644 RepID=A0A7L4YP55_9ACTN|nr:AMP-binding protein [Epidermidibacterium keratini]QHC00812.1 AMP-binding protein [Epidermidibacterium keratini]